MSGRKRGQRERIMAGCNQELFSHVPSVKTQVSFNKFAVENTVVHESR